MLGGLYGDLPPPADEEKSSSTPVSSSVWSSSVKMAPPTLRKAPSVVRPPSVLNKPKTPNLKPHPAAVVEEASAASFQPALVGVPSTVVEEYDPARPNDYEDYRREKKKKAMEAEIRRELEKRRRQEEEERERERERDSSGPGGGGLNININITGEEAWRRRAAMSGPPRSPSPPPGANMTAAQRMMAKMGWKEGQGLGKQEQGITTPLMAKKTDRRAGVIVNASENKQDKKLKSVNFNGPPTRVLLLRNMVGPGEVDDELEDEVGSECSKYGSVTRVVIFEITEPSFPSEEAVRIFVQFERSEETTKAYVDLDGRFFGGRTVKAAFYDEEMFNQNELAPLPGQVPGF